MVAVQDGVAGSTVAAAGAAVAARLLVVDDDENNRDMISRRLARRGFDVDLACDGQRALDAIEAADGAGGPFDLVLLDIEMPGLSGFDVLRLVRERHPATRLPVVIATARHDREDVVQALSLGANDYVTKPIDFVVVLARIEAQLAHKRAVDRIVALESEVRRRNGQLQQANDRMRHSLEMAARVQRSLLPDLPHLHVRDVELAWSFHPCDELGGDTLGAFPMAGGHVGFYLLDVSGHGVPSSLLSVAVGRALVPTAGHASLVEHVGPDGQLGPRPPAEVVSELNRRFPMGDRGGQYLTIFYAVLGPPDPGGARPLQYVSAGHPPAVLVSGGAGQGPKVLAGDGMAVGWFAEAEFDEQAATLWPGDRLYVYSDGVIETMAHDAAHFGVTRLSRLLGQTRCQALPDCLSAVGAALDEYRAGTEPLDDVTIMAVQVPAVGA